jgi:SAM-dependent methyltransferase
MTRPPESSPSAPHGSDAPTSTTAYDRWHDELEDADEVGTPSAPWHLLTIPHLGDIRGKSVLEIGCGRGVFAAYLAGAGARVVAADFSPSAVAHAERRIAPLGGTAIVADIQQIPFADASFDLVVSQETLEHVPRPEAGLAELVRVTRPGGRLIITGPNYLSLMGLYRIGLRMVGRRYSELGQPINQPLILPRQVRRVRRLGCQVIHVDAVGQFVPIPRVGTVRLRLLEHPHSLMKWTCHNSIIVSQRTSVVPARESPGEQG